MKNIVGQVPRGADFYPRDHVINKIRRRLGNGAHLYLAAPRRVGKTALMFHLQDNPLEGYAFHYLTVESVESLAAYFKRLKHLKTLHPLRLRSLRLCSGRADRALHLRAFALCFTKK